MRANSFRARLLSRNPSMASCLPAPVPYAFPLLLCGSSGSICLLLSLDTNSDVDLYARSAMRETGCSHKGLAPSSSDGLDNYMSRIPARNPLPLRGWFLVLDFLVGEWHLKALPIPLYPPRRISKFTNTSHQHQRLLAGIPGQCLIQQNP